MNTPPPTNTREPLGWYSRGYLPHLDAPDILQSLAFRLADSVPRELLRRWIEEWRRPQDLAGSPMFVDQGRQARLERLVSRFEDAGHGACHLKRPAIAVLVEAAFLSRDGDRYRLIEWCVMPNHVHVLIEPLRRTPLSDIVRSWKTFTARRANQILGRTGTFWMRDYFDRYIRDQRHLDAVRRYIWLNPVRAGLCREVRDWPWSSARLRTERELGVTSRRSRG